MLSKGSRRRSNRSSSPSWRDELASTPRWRDLQGVDVWRVPHTRWWADFSTCVYWRRRLKYTCVRERGQVCYEMCSLKIVHKVKSSPLKVKSSPAKVKSSPGFRRRFIYYVTQLVISVPLSTIDTGGECHLINSFHNVFWRDDSFSYHPKMNEMTN